MVGVTVTKDMHTRITEQPQELLLPLLKRIVAGIDNEHEVISAEYRVLDCAKDLFANPAKPVSAYRFSHTAG